MDASRVHTSQNAHSSAPQLMSIWTNTEEAAYSNSDSSPNVDAFWRDNSLLLTHQCRFSRVNWLIAILLFYKSCECHIKLPHSSLIKSLCMRFEHLPISGSVKQTNYADKSTTCLLFPQKKRCPKHITFQSFPRRKIPSIHIIPLSMDFIELILLASIWAIGQHQVRECELVLLWAMIWY